MSLHARELQQIVGELREGLVNAFVQKAFAPLPLLAVLELRVPGSSITLVLSAEPQVARLSVADERPPSPPKPLPFQTALRKELIGARLADVTQPAPHTALLTFERRGDKRRVALTLQGPSANVLLLHENGNLLSASARNAHTPRPGQPWAPEPADVEEAIRAAPPSRLSAGAEPNASARFPFAAAAQALLAGKSEGQRAEVVRKRLAAPLKAKLKRLERTMEKVRAEADRAKEAEGHRAQGELLAQNLHLVTRGAQSVKLTRWTEKGAEEVSLKLDPKRAPKEQVEWHFHQYRRLTRGEEHARRRLEELEAECAQTQAELDALNEQSDDALAEQAPALVQQAASEKKKGPERGKPYKVFVAGSGHRILVGRGSEANDELTFHVALPHHLWFHALGVPGSHVVLERKKGEPIPPETLLDAAHLAHHHGQRKDEPRGEVAWTEARFVRKTKGAAPGAVTYTREKVLLLRVEPDRLQRLLRSTPI